LKCFLLVGPSPIYRSVDAEVSPFEREAGHLLAGRQAEAELVPGRDREVEEEERVGGSKVSRKPKNSGNF